MGAEQSASRQAPTPPTVKKCTRRSRAREARNWKHAVWAEVYTCSLRSWSGGGAAIFDFDNKVDYCINNEKYGLESVVQNIQPYCTKGYQFKIEKLHRNGIKATTPAFENGQYKTPLVVCKRSSYEYPVYAPTVSIIGFQRKIAVLQVVYKKIKELHFIAIDLSSGRHLSIFKDIYVSEPCIYEAYISPDETCYLLRPNFFFAFSRCLDPFMAFSITRDIRMISIGDFDSQLTKAIEDVSDLWHSIAFDPRYGHSRVAFGNYSRSGTDSHCVVTYDLAQMSVRSFSSDSDFITSHHLNFNPQGSVLVSLGIRFVSPRMDLMNPAKVVFYSTDTLQVLRVMSRETIHVNHFHASLSPIFSKTGEHIALIGCFGQNISVYKMPMDLNLRHLCRLVIIRHTAEERTAQLPLPKRLIDYVQFLPLLK